jgi:hypothetical protein
LDALGKFPIALATFMRKDQPQKKKKKKKKHAGKKKKSKREPFTIPQQTPDADNMSESRKKSKREDYSQFTISERLELVDEFLQIPPKMRRK